jgi:hypothetical protein
MSPIHPDGLSGEYKRVCPDCREIGSLAAQHCSWCGRSFADTGLQGDRDGQ